MTPYRHILAAGIAALALASCAGPEPGDAADVLARAGQSTLSRSELQAAIPAGLSADDSTSMARAYIRAWAQRQLIAARAGSELDLTEINRMVDDYRAELIMWEYTRRMYAAHGRDSIGLDSLRAYYAAHSSELRAQRPMVKGVYIKVPDDAPSLSALRRLYRSTRPADVDRLEKSELAGAVHYDYFRDQWVDWEQIENRIPYDFSAEGLDAFLRSRRHLDFSAGGFTYLLDISDVIPAGAPLPFEAARPVIEERLDYTRRLRYERELRDKIFNDALDDGSLKLYTDI